MYLQILTGGKEGKLCLAFPLGTANPCSSPVCGVDTPNVKGVLNDQDLSIENRACYSCTWKISVRALNFVAVDAIFSIA